MPAPSCKKNVDYKGTGRTVVMQFIVCGDMQIKIRFNTNKDKVDHSLPAWRVIVDGVENFAEKVSIRTETWTSQDEVAPGVLKWHISCTGIVRWNAAHTECTIY